jgi:alpha-ribazole phosphatase/probable phosphoglycerate mutase
MPKLVTTIDLMRHGEPVGGRRYRGQTDDPLSEKGWGQMRAAVGEHKPWQHIVSSPLSRCHAFATELSQKHDLPLSIDARFMEVRFGEWEGQTAEQLEARDPDIIARFRRDPIGQRPAGAEPLEAFLVRVAAAWSDMLATHAGKHVLLVCHAGVIRMTLAHVLGVPLARTYFIDVPSAGLTRITVDGEGLDAVAQLRFHAGKL